MSRRELGPAMPARWHEMKTIVNRQEETTMSRKTNVERCWFGKNTNEIFREENQP